LNSHRVIDQRNRGIMGFRVSGRAILSVASAFIALFAAGPGMPSRALAGCSSYIVAHPDPLARLAHVQILERSTSAASIEIEPLVTTAAGPKPCTGPFCSERRADPRSVPDASDPVPAVRWGFLSEALTLLAPTGQVLPAVDSPGRPARHGFSIERPPRPREASIR
jgi:hypothetical protein